MKKRVLSAALAASMAISMTPAAAFAAPGAEGHWAEGVLDEWMGYGVVRGFDDGTGVHPDDAVTRAEFVTMLDRVMGYKAEVENVYSDVALDWYTDYVLRGVAAGVIKGDDNGSTMRPNDPVSRQEACVILARVLDLDVDSAPDAGFSDQADIADWAQGAVNAMKAAGYVAGNDGEFRPDDGATRAEAVKMLDNIFAGLYQESGEYTGDVDGSAVVSADGVDLKGQTVEGDLVVSEGVDDGHVELDGVTVEGRLIVRGGGVNSVVLKGGSKVGEIVVDRQSDPVRVVIEDGCEVGSVTVAEDTVSLVLEGSVPSVSVETPGAELSVAGEVGTLTVAEEAEGAKVSVEKGAVVKSMSIAAGDVSVEGDGEVESVVVEKTAGSGVVIDVDDATVENKSEENVTVGGEIVKPGETVKPEVPSTGGSSSGGVVVPTPDPDDPVDPDDPADVNGAETALVNAWEDLNEAFAKVTGNDEEQIFSATVSDDSSSLSFCVNMDAIQATEGALTNDQLSGLATEFKTALDNHFDGYSLSMGGQEVYRDGVFNNTALKNALFGVSDGFFYTLANMTSDGNGVYTYKTLEVSVASVSDEADAFGASIDVQLSGDDVAKVQSLSETLADHLAMEKFGANEVMTRYGLTSAQLGNESEVVVVTAEMPDALMEKAAEIAATTSQSGGEVQDIFDRNTVGTFLGILSRDDVKLESILGNNAAEVNSVLSTVNSNANLINKVLGKMSVTVTPPFATGTTTTGTLGAFNPGADGDAYHNFMAGLAAMASEFSNMTPKDFKVSSSSVSEFNDGTYYAVPMKVDIDLESSMGFKATETVVVVLHVDFGGASVQASETTPAEQEEITETPVVE